MAVKRIPLEELAPVIEETLAGGGTFEININGTSMLPLLVEGRDTVVLTAADGFLKKGDVPLFRRSDGSFVLHRIVRADNGVYTVCGDNQWVKESGVSHEQVLGVVCRINRKGKEIDVRSAGYRLYCAVWGALFPLRKYLVKIRGKLKK